jgi:dTDP-4-amino-4,6-dideoxygalactose transaminase
LKTKILLSPPHMSGEEKKYIDLAFGSNWIAPAGSNIDGFERDLAAFTGANGVVALSSGTAAMHLALILLGVNIGDEVICPDFTFTASVNPVIYQGATPVFVDSETETWNMDPVLLQKAIKDRLNKGIKPAAIIVAHIYGMPANMDKITTIAKEFDIPVVEDAAEALGSLYYGKAVGTLGRMGVLSFNGNKIITTSGGGALLSDDTGLIQKAGYLATQAKSAVPYYEHEAIGYNYRMSNILAGIGRGQMTVLKERITQRKTIFAYYKDHLSHIPGISFLNEPRDYYSNRWLTTILVDPLKGNGITREEIRLALMEEEIESRPLWNPMHRQPVFRNYPAYLHGISDMLFRNGLCLPSGSNLKKHEMDKVIQTIERLFKN